MMGPWEASSFYLSRMILLLGEIYLDFPIQNSKLNYFYMKELFFELDDQKSNRINQYYLNF